MLVSLGYRRAKDLPILPRRPPDAVFYQDGASGRSHRNLFTMLGGARNCLTVAVTPDQVIVRPFLPFNLMFLPELMDLEHEISRRNLRVEVRKGIFVDGYVLTFTRDDGRDVTLDLRVRHGDQFLAALGKPGS